MRWNALELSLAALIAALCLVPAPGHSSSAVAADEMEMVLVPEGTFYMGSEGEDVPDDEMPRHEIHLDAFLIDRYEVTNGMFARFLNDRKPGEGKGGRRWKAVVIRNDLDTEERRTWWPTEIAFRNGRYEAVKGFERYPVMAVSWFAAAEYCTWAGKRLPTEAEWEKAARGGLKDRDYPWGNQIPTYDRGLVFGRLWKDNLAPPPTEKVGNYPSNGFGLFGMAGNVAEWTADWYRADYYTVSAAKNPRGPHAGQFRVIRGGSWSSAPSAIRVAKRMFDRPAALSDGVGFRCARSEDD